jgi:hypothetical protein
MPVVGPVVAIDLRSDDQRMPRSGDSEARERPDDGAGWRRAEIGARVTVRRGGEHCRRPAAATGAWKLLSRAVRALAAAFAPGVAAAGAPPGDSPKSAATVEPSARRSTARRRRQVRGFDRCVHLVRVSGAVWRQIGCDLKACE